MNIKLTIPSSQTHCHPFLFQRELYFVSALASMMPTLEPSGPEAAFAKTRAQRISMEPRFLEFDCFAERGRQMPSERGKRTE
jgi:hypothetical protein